MICAMTLFRNTFLNRRFLPLFVLCWLLFSCISVITLNQFINNGDGTEKKKKRGLMWLSKDNGVPISWPVAIASI